MAKTRMLQRKNLIVDPAKVRKLRGMLSAPSESEAVRRAVDQALDSIEAIAALERIRKRGTWGSRLA